MKWTNSLKDREYQSSCKKLLKKKKGIVLTFVEEFKLYHRPKCKT